MEATIPLSIDFDDTVITGHMYVHGGHGFVSVDRYPPTVQREDARMALVVGVLTRNIEIDIEVAAAVDLIGPNPRVH